MKSSSIHWGNERFCWKMPCLERHRRMATRRYPHFMNNTQLHIRVTTLHTGNGWLTKPVYVQLRIARSDPWFHVTDTSPSTPGSQFWELQSRCWTAPAASTATMCGMHPNSSRTDLCSTSTGLGTPGNFDGRNDNIHDEKRWRPPQKKIRSS